MSTLLPQPEAPPAEGALPPPISFQGWLDTPIAGRAFMSLAMNDLVMALHADTGLSVLHSTIAVAGATSLILGPGTVVRSPSHKQFPLSLQFTIRKDGERHLFAGTTARLCEAAVNCLADQIAPLEFEDDKELTAQQLALEKDLKQAMADRNLAKSRVDDGLMVQSEYEQICMKGYEVWLDHCRTIRKRGLFPVGDVLDVEQVRATLRASTSFAVFASFSPHGKAPRHLLSCNPRERDALCDFITTGWRGEMFNRLSSPARTPQTACVWIASSDMVRQDLWEALPGMLFLNRAADAATSSAAPLAYLDKAKALFSSLVTKYTIPPGDRSTGQVREITLDPDAARVLREALNTIPPRGEPGASLWAGAELQILKLAAIISLEPDLYAPPETFVLRKEFVETAVLAYRFMLKETLNCLASGCESVVAGQVTRIVEKLRKHGPMKLRDLARRCHKQQSWLLKQILEAGIQSGQIQHRDGVYHALLK